MTLETRTYDLAEVLERTGVPSELWLRRRLNSGELRGRLAGRKWRMTDSDIAFLVEYMARGPKSSYVVEPMNDSSAAPVPSIAAQRVGDSPTVPVTSLAAGLTPRSRQRVKRRSA